MWFAQPFNQSAKVGIKVQQKQSILAQMTNVPQLRAQRFTIVGRLVHNCEPIRATIVGR